MKSICLAVSCLIITSVAAADTITVCSSGCDHTSINAAIDAASNGDVIQLSAETYSEGDVINPLGKAITLRGAVDKSGAALSILDGGNSHRVLYCHSGEGAGTVFENLIIQNGRNSACCSDGFGGGMINWYGCSPTLTNCTFQDNYASDVGGGMVNWDGSSPTLTNCTFTNNSASFEGGGMLNNHGSSPTLTNCMFTGNEPGAIYSSPGSGSNPSLADTTVCENLIPWGEQISGVWTDLGGNCISDSCKVCASECFGYDNDCDNPEVLPGDGGYDFDTVCAAEADHNYDTSGICDPGPFGDDICHSTHYFKVTMASGGTLIVSTCNTVDWDTRLIVAESCDPSTTLACNDDAPGCLGYTSYLEVALDAGDYLVGVGGYAGDSGPGILLISGTGVTACPGDINGDGEVNGGDLGLLLAMWGEAGGDLNGDGTTDGGDLGLLLSAWGPCP